MSDTFSIRVDGCEIARITGSVSFGKRCVDRISGKMEDDPHIMRIAHNEKTVVVFYVSTADGVAVQKVEG